ncbi:MAG: methylmalonic aciduria and homocystinuria type D protein [Cyanobacteria bacterium J06598_4]
MLYKTSLGTKIDICIAPPHQYVVDHQLELLPGWNAPISYLIIVLQQSSVSFAKSSDLVTLEKDRLRTKFLRFGSSLIFALLDRGYQSDIFDPRTGYPMLAQPGIVLDDNAVVKALLNYPVVDYQKCSLIRHPAWGHQVYPGTIVTAAPQTVVEPSLQQAVDSQNWTLNN